MTTEEILNTHVPNQENLLMALQEIQNNNPLNYITEEDLEQTTRYFNLKKSTVYGVVTYYSMLSLKPRGKHLIRVCTSPICKMNGTESILNELQNLLDLQPGNTSTDSQFTLEETECLGFCFNSPAMLVDEDIYGSLTVDKLAEILSQYQKGGEKDV